MWPRRPTIIPLVEDHPRLAYGTLKQAGALNPGKVTYWNWNTPTAALSVRVTGGQGTFTIATGSNEVQVVLRGRWIVCPHCGRLGMYLLYRGEWQCQRCSGCDWAVRHRFRTFPVLKRQRLRQLAKRPVLDLRASELRYELAKVDQAIIERIRDVHRRVCPRQR